MTSSTVFQAICEDPYNDELRLVYADEQVAKGTARGQLIQLQHMLLEQQFDAAQRALIREDIRSILRTHSVDLLKPLRSLGGGFQLNDGSMGEASPVFSRGFVEWISCSVSAFLRFGSLVMRLTPLRGVHFTEGSLVELAKHPNVERLQGLRFGLRCTDVEEGLAKLLSMKKTPIKSLRFALPFSEWFSSMSLLQKAIFQERIQTLNAFEISEIPLREEDICFLSLPLFAHVKHLQSSYSGEGDRPPDHTTLLGPQKDYRPLLHRFESLKSIVFADHPSAWIWLYRLQNTPKISNLRTLDLSFNRMRSTDVQQFEEIPFSSLQSLSLRGNALSSDGASKVFHLQNVPQLKELDLSRNGITHLPISQEVLPNIEVLNISENPVQTSEILKFLHSHACPNLRVLQLPFATKQDVRSTEISHRSELRILCHDLQSRASND